MSAYTHAMESITYDGANKNIEKFKEMAKNSVSKDKIKNKQKEQSL